MVPRLQYQASMAPSSSSTQQGQKRLGRRDTAASSGSGPSVANAWVPGRSPPDGVPPLLRVGCCLSAHWRHWQALGAESWVLSVLRDGYRILFRDSPPPLTGTPISFPTSRAGSPRSLALCQVVVEILSMAALEIILDPGPGLSSRLFLMEKIAVAWCPMIDLSRPNEFVLQSPFMIETVASVLLCI